MLKISQILRLVGFSDYAPFFQVGSGLHFGWSRLRKIEGTTKIIPCGLASLLEKSIY
jgi:hypothetical protein